jgi:enolase
VGMDLSDQAALDAKLIGLDGTANKSRLGANAVLGVSLAAAHAAAASGGEELFVHLNRLWSERKARSGAATGPSLPIPMVNMISGGLHAGGNLDIQDVLVIPVTARRFGDALEMVVSVYRALGGILKKSGFESDLVGDEGGYGPRLDRNEQAFELVVDAISACGLEPGVDAAIAVDVASSHFFDPVRGIYTLRAGGGRALDSGGMIELLTDWVARYPIVSVEDGLAEDDWDGWKSLTGQLGSPLQLIGDDLFATQVSRLRRGIASGVANAVLIKVNQVGTLSETLDAIRLAHDHGFQTIVSARSGETEDTTIADLAVATGAGQIKIGSVARSERLAKYNRLLRIDELLEDIPDQFARFPKK